MQASGPAIVFHAQPEFPALGVGKALQCFARSSSDKRVRPLLNSMARASAGGSLPAVWVRAVSIGPRLHFSQWVWFSTARRLSSRRNQTVLILISKTELSVCYSARIFASRMTLPHFAISFFR